MFLGHGGVIADSTGCGQPPHLDGAEVHRLGDARPVIGQIVADWVHRLLEWPAAPNNSASAASRAIRRRRAHAFNGDAPAVVVNDDLQDSKASLLVEAAAARSWVATGLDFGAFFCRYRAGAGVGVQPFRCVFSAHVVVRLPFPRIRFSLTTA